MPRLSFASLRFRLLLLVLLAVIPALGLTLYTHSELRSLIAADVQREALRLVRIAASDQEDTIKDTRQLLFALAQLPEVYTTDPAACSGFFTRLLNQYPQYALLGVIERDGDLLCSTLRTSDPVNLAHRSYFQRVLQTRDCAVGDYERVAISGKATLDFGCPVFDEIGQVEAVTFASLDLTWLNQLAAEAQLPEGSTLTVVDHNGAILVRYPDPETWVGVSMLEAPIIKTILARQGEGTAEAYGIDGVSRLFAFTPLSGIPMGGDVYVSIGIPTAVAFADTNRVLALNLGGLGLVTVLALAAAWFGGNLFVLRWVNMLLSATKRLSAGDLGVRTGLPDRGELGQLAYAFDEMAESLQRRVAERDQAEEALRESQRALSTLLSNLPGMAYRCRNDRDWTMEFVSEGCRELTGYQPSELVANQRVSYGQLIHLEDRESVWNEVQAALQANGPFQITYRILTAAGEEKWAWGQGQVVFSPEGDVLALEGYVVDATERVLAQQVLEQQVADRTRELSALYDVMAVTSASLDLETILESSLDPVLAAMESEVGAIHLLDEIEGVLRLVAWRGIPADLVAKVSSVSVDSGLTGWIVERGEPMVVPNIATGLRPLLAIPVGGAQTYVGAPIRAKEQVLGVLSVVGETGRQFKAEEVTLLASIADEVGVAVENARLYDAERTRRHQADTLLRAASTVGSTLELDQVLVRVLDQLRQVVDCDSASVQFLEEGDLLQIIAGQGFTDIEHVLGIVFPRSEDVPNWKVVDEGRPLNLADAPVLYPVLRRTPHSHTRSWLGVPLCVQKRVIGIITLDRQQPGGYTEEEVRMATAFADLAALAMENARLYRQAEQLAVVRERERLARELHDSVTQSLYSLTLLAEAGGRLVEAGELERVAGYLDRLGEISQQALKEMRLLVYQLRPLVLRRDGLVGALQQRLDAVERRAGVNVRLLVEGDIGLSASVEEGLYRIAQEALNNALKHAAATSVTVTVRGRGDQAELEVMDDGTGFDPGALSDKGGMGLISMRERAEKVGGTVAVLSRPGEGTRVRVAVGGWQSAVSDR